jgi:hypothetical protein
VCVWQDVYTALALGKKTIVDIRSRNERKTGEKKKKEKRRSTKNDNCSVRLILLARSSFLYFLALSAQFSFSLLRSFMPTSGSQSHRLEIVPMLVVGFVIVPGKHDIGQLFIRLPTIIAALIDEDRLFEVR